MNSRNCVLALTTVVFLSALGAVAQEVAPPAGTAAPPPATSAPAPPENSNEILKSLYTPEIRERYALQNQVALPETLEGALETAMRMNPEVVQAETKLREAEMTLRQAKLKIAQETKSAFDAYMSRKEQFQQAEKECNDKWINLHREGKLPPEVVSGADRTSLWGPRAGMQYAAGLLAQAELAFRSVLGLDVSGTALNMDNGSAANGTPKAVVRETKLVEAVRPAITPEMRQKFHLDATATLEFAAGTPLTKILEFLAEYCEVNVVSDLGLDTALKSSFLTRNFTLEKVFCALSDAMGGEVVFVIRDYGVLATKRELAERMNAPTIPEGVALYIKP